MIIHAFVCTFGSIFVFLSLSFQTFSDQIIKISLRTFLRQWWDGKEIKVKDQRQALENSTPQKPLSLQLLSKTLLLTHGRSCFIYIHINQS